MNLQEVYNLSIKNNTINPDLIKILAANYCLKNGLKGYVNNIMIYDHKIPNCSDKVLGQYNPVKNDLYISNEVSYASFLDSSLYKKAHKINTSKQQLNELYIYFYLTTIYHELSHAVQEKEALKNDSLLNQILYQVFDYANDETDIYEQNHDCFAIEHNADAVGAFEATKFNQQYGQKVRITSVPYLKKLLDGYVILPNHYVVGHMEKLYHTHKDSRLYEILYKSLNLNLLTRLEYGFPISLNEYNIVSSSFVRSDDVAKTKQNILSYSK